MWNRFILIISCVSNFVGNKFWQRSSTDTACTHCSCRINLFGFQDLAKSTPETNSKWEKQVCTQGQEGNACTYSMFSHSVSSRKFSIAKQLGATSWRTTTYGGKCQTHFPYFPMPGACTLYLHTCTKSSGVRRTNKFLRSRCAVDECIQRQQQQQQKETAKNHNVFHSPWVIERKDETTNYLIFFFFLFLLLFHFSSFCYIFQCFLRALSLRHRKPCRELSVVCCVQTTYAP